MGGWRKEKGVKLDEWRQMGGHRQRKDCEQMVPKPLCHWVGTHGTTGTVGRPRAGQTWNTENLLSLSSLFHSSVHSAGTMRNGAAGN